MLQRIALLTRALIFAWRVDLQQFTHNDHLVQAMFQTVVLEHSAAS